MICSNAPSVGWRQSFFALTKTEEARVLASCDVSNFEIVAAIVCLAQQTADGSAMISRNDIYPNYCK